MRAGRAAALIVGLLAALGCPRPIRISIVQGREHFHALDGGLVRVDGTFRKFTDPGGDYFVLEDDERNRIGLTGPIAALLPPFADRPGRVTGVLHYGPERGFYLEGRSIEPR